MFAYTNNLPLSVVICDEHDEVLKVEQIKLIVDDPEKQEPVIIQVKAKLDKD